VPRVTYSVVAKSWSEDEDAKWTAALEERKCTKCGGKKVTVSSRGRPYMAYLEWAEAKSEELGWTVQYFSGCTESG